MSHGISLGGVAIHRRGVSKIEQGGKRSEAHFAARSLLKTSWRALVSPFEPMPPLYSLSYVAYGVQCDYQSS